jgi:hypothetical protein
MASVLRVYKYSMGAGNALLYPTDGGVESAAQFLQINIPVVIADDTATKIFQTKHTINGIVTSRLTRSDTGAALEYDLEIGPDQKSLILTPAGDTIVDVTQLFVHFTYVI